MPSNCGPGEDSWESIGLHGIKPVNPKGNQPQIFIERTDTEARVPIIWPPDAKSQLIGKDPDTGKEWRQKKRAAEDELVIWYYQLDRQLVIWYYQLDGHEFEQTPGDSGGQGSLACCSLWGVKESDTT